MNPRPHCQECRVIGVFHNNVCDGCRKAGCEPAVEALARYEQGSPAKPDAVNHPAHYTEHPSGVECIQITEHMGFNLGNATKYIWRCDLKLDAVEGLKKAIWYLERELAKRTKS